MEDLKQEFARHLASLGFEFNTPREAILEKLRKRMGNQRFEAFQNRHAYSVTSQEEFYRLFHDIIEGNLMRSLDTCATLDASFSLYQRCAGWLERGMRVIELGCWTGGLASFVAMRHPDCSVVGTDLSQEVVNACCSYYQLPNLSFKRWNYRWARPDALKPADVLLCAMGVVHHMPHNGSLPNPREVRRCQEYKTQRDHAVGYFGMWRLAAVEGGILFAALRIGLFARFLAWIDAAQEAGWTPRLDRLWHVDMTGEKSPLPGLMFEARRCDPMREEAIVDRWTWFTRRDHLYACVEGAPAMAAFRALTDKNILGSREYRHEGVLTRDEVGVAGGTGYVFTHDAVFQFRLLLVSQDRAEELAAGISAEGSSTPISNDGWFRRSRLAGSLIGGSFFSGTSGQTMGRKATFGGTPIAYLGD